MRLGSYFVAVAICLSATSLWAGSPEQDKAFIDKYRTAFEANDKATLQSFLYTQGANPMVLEFYRMMQTDGAGQKISKIELVNLSPEDVKKAEAVMDGPGGQKIRLPLKPTKKLIIVVEQKTADSSTKTSSESFIAEVNGKYVIPVPASAK
jgi:hypothetical protein